MAANSVTIHDEDGDAEDWIELYNFGNQAINLQWFGLSDDFGRPFRWVFPDITLEPGEFLLIWASGKNRRDPESELHTNFSISSEGEEILLTSFDGMRIDELAPVRLPSDVSIGRQPDGTGEWLFFNDPTPGTPNITEGYRNQLERPFFSHPSGFYNSNFELNISHPEPGATIYYTLDGSEPSPDSDVWTLPLTISDRSDEPNVISMIRTTNSETRSEGWQEPGGLIPKATVIRAKAFKDGYLPGAMHTQSYFIFPEGSDFHQLPVFSLVTDPENLFDYHYGIYIPEVYGESGAVAAGNFQNRGIEWERQGSLELFETNGYPVLSNQMGYRIHGGWTRQNAQKSLRLYARGGYGDNRFNYRFFPDQPYNEFNRLILRNSGNDWAYSMFRDALAQRIVSHLNIDTQAYRSTVLYINGEYWGIHNIRERYDRHYLERVYGLQENDIDLLTGRHYADEGDNVHWLNTLAYARDHDLSDDAHFNHMQSLIDFDNYLDYFVTNIFYANNDWPHNNIDYFRKRVPYNPDAPPGHDGRWRWLLVDLDRSFNLSTFEDFNMMEWVTLKYDGRRGLEWPNLLFRNLLENESFQLRFLQKITQHLNTTFHPDRVTAMIDSMKAAIEPEMERQILRWQKQGSLDGWLNHSAGVNAMYRFAHERPSHLRKHIREHFGIESDQILQVDTYHPDLGYVRVDSIDIIPSTPGVGSNPELWNGYFFHGMPVELEAYPASDAVFSYWEIDDSVALDPRITLPMRSDTRVKAVFKQKSMDLLHPEPYPLNNIDYIFTKWPVDAPDGTAPAHMAFVYMGRHDPEADVPIAGFTNGAFNLDDGTRINGLNNKGFSFVNGSGTNDSNGYPGRKLGGALLALDTRGRDHINVLFNAELIRQNSRVYGLRLQYRIGKHGPFLDVTEKDGSPVNFVSLGNENHTKTMGPATLPPETGNQDYVQLLFRYYATDTKLDFVSEAASEMGISYIHVASERATEAGETDENRPGKFLLEQNYPNPFNSRTMILFELPEPGPILLDVYSLNGRHVARLADGYQSAGSHQVIFDAGKLASGVYLYRLQSDFGTLRRKMMLLR